ncbi:MAG: TetR/AcrR family transcriptional regulator C-terminal domain-containing protein [Verrucomicrobia bacterium]|nr:TetR/AcrR family transcriptional regulator C-terminal domain-containing protein [Verrucomicrobiota bacterium]
MLAYRDGARIHAGTRPSNPQFETAEAQLRFLCDAGFTTSDAAFALLTLSNYTVGSVLEEQASGQQASEKQTSKADATDHEAVAAEEASRPPPLLAEVLADKTDFETVFEYGLSAIIDGFGIKLNEI